VDAERLLSFRSAINEGREDKISLNSLFVKLAASAIAKHPAINASWEGDSIRYRKSVDVALAVALPDGLVAPVVRDCASKGIEQIEQEFRALIARAKSGGLKPEDYEGATFTVSNLGAWGVEEFTAIINPPGARSWPSGR
jgi:pyruvate dehydrogenase E2 component (dihydrolipoamide acetyltransferase)